MSLKRADTQRSDRIAWFQHLKRTLQFPPISNPKDPLSSASQFSFKEKSQGKSLQVFSMFDMFEPPIRGANLGNADWGALDGNGRGFHHFLVKHQRFTPPRVPYREHGHLGTWLFLGKYDQTPNSGSLSEVVPRCVSRYAETEGTTSCDFIGSRVSWWFSCNEHPWTGTDQCSNCGDSRKLDLQWPQFSGYSSIADPCSGARSFLPCRVAHGHPSAGPLQRWSQIGIRRWSRFPLGPSSQRQTLGRNRKWKHVKSCESPPSTFHWAISLQKEKWLSST